ncbi:unnamed protein product [Pedinophyceae sp. YPF-701]|nr:unnamed protein product [Pedinophyceae sp. YPF-701]
MPSPLIFQSISSTHHAACGLLRRCAAHSTALLLPRMPPPGCLHRPRRPSVSARNNVLVPDTRPGAQWRQFAADSGRRKRGARQFIDATSLTVRGGKGGPGSMSFVMASGRGRNLRPDGGDGGRGGDVLLRVSRNLWDLSHLQRSVKAENGAAGSSNRLRGADGRDQVVLVPPGTVVRRVRAPGGVGGDVAADVDMAGLRGDLDIAQMIEDLDAQEAATVQAIHDVDQQDLVAELLDDGAEITVARGGARGHGSAFLKQPNVPLDRATDHHGHAGEHHRLALELRLVADVALVGLPNAGKSSLLGALTRASPRVGHYAFTTVRPNLGVIRAQGLAGDDLRVVDVPGLVAGASRDRGLGLTFLRHVKRCRALAFVLDMSPGLAGGAGAGPRPWEQWRQLHAELREFDPELLELPRVAVGTKMDLLARPGATVAALKRHVDAHVCAVSVRAGAGIDRLRQALVLLAEQSAVRDLRRTA